MTAKRIVVGISILLGLIFCSFMIGNKYESLVTEPPIRVPAWPVRKSVRVYQPFLGMALTLACYIFTAILISNPINRRSRRIAYAWGLAALAMAYAVGRHTGKEVSTLDVPKGYEVALHMILMITVGAVVILIWDWLFRKPKTAVNES